MYINMVVSSVDYNSSILSIQTAVAFAEYRFLQTKSEDKYEGEIASLKDQDFVTEFDRAAMLTSIA